MIFPYPHMISQLEAVWDQVFNQSVPADRAIEKVLKSHRKWGARDRRLFVEWAHQGIKWKRLIVHRSGLPQFASPAFWQSFKVWAAEQTNWPVEQRTLTDQALPFVVRESIPDWLDVLGRSQMSASDWENSVISLNGMPQIDLRVNLSKTTRSAVVDSLRSEGYAVELIDDSLCGIHLVQRKNIFLSQAYLKGWLEVQDRASQQVALILAPRAGERVVDLCAGAGGKTLHLADLMGNKGQVIALDISDFKLNECRKRANRCGFFNIETRLADSKNLKRLHKSADRVLVDAPCSGLGVLRRNPDTKWRLIPDDMNKIQTLQLELLEKSLQLLKPGHGVLVYSTCSFLASENSDQIHRFLELHPELALLEEKSILPFKNQGDGFYMAALQYRS